MLLSDLSNFDQGFGIYDDTLPHPEPNRAYYERIAEETVQSTLLWLHDAPEDRPLFLWVHLMDPHGPYKPPEEYEDRFQGGPDEELPRNKIPGYQFLGSRNKADYVNRYDAEIVYCDDWIGKLVAGLKKKGLYDEALVVFHADHGEAMGEHGYYFRHGQDLYEPSVRIPLLLKLPAWRRPPVQTSDILASVIDIYPTIVDCLDLPPPQGIDGVSLLGLLASGAGGHRRLLLEKIGPKARDQGSLQIGIRDNRRKLIYRIHDDAERTILAREYYDLETDAGEQSSTYDESDPETAALEAALEELWSTVRNYQLPFETIYWEPEDPAKFIQQLDKTGLERDPAADAEALRALGYLDDEE
jgi:arylsulfatase A-like enzyme